MTNHSILEGFEFVPAESIPSITLDNQLRIYLNSTARKLLGVKPYDRLAIAYRPASREIAIIKAYAGEATAEYSTSNFVVDKRYYLHTRVLARLYEFKPSKAPYHFEYSRGASDGSVFVFRLIGGDEWN